MKQYLKRTWKNKLIALVLLFGGLIPIWLEGDATILAILLIAITPLFFANKNFIE